MTGPAARSIPAYLAACGLLCALQAVSWAAPRRVAVVNAAQDQDSGAKGAAELRRVLTDLEPLAPIPEGTLARALEGALADRTSADQTLARAKKAMKRAQSHYESFALDRALAELGRAQELLVVLEPTSELRETLSEISVRRGLALMGKPDRAAALDAFRLARALDPERDQLDAATFDPEVVKTFAAAGNPPAEDATIEVTATYSDAVIYVDGHRARGPRVPVAPGRHTVTAAFHEYRPSGQVVEVESGQTRTIKLELWPESSDERAQALRRGLVAASSPLAYRTAARAVASLTGTDAVVMVRGDTPGALAVAVFDTADQTVSDWMKLQGADPTDLLEDILPAARARPVPDPFVEDPPPPPPPEPWWKQRTWQAVMGGGVAATITGIVLFSLATGGESQQAGGSFGGPDLFD